jgi:hypothetical protein
VTYVTRAGKTARPGVLHWKKVIVERSAERFVSESQIGLAGENPRAHDPTGRHSPRTETLAAEAGDARILVLANRSDFFPGAGIAGGGIIMQSTCGSNPKGPMP